MKTLTMNRSLGLGLLAVLACAILIVPNAASAAVISTVDTTGSYSTASGWVLTDDLLQVSGSTVSLTNYTPTSTATGNSGDILRDGSIGTTLGLDYANMLLESPSGGADGWIAEYAFDTSVNTEGYDIYSIASISAANLSWTDLDPQSFDLFVHTVGGDWTEIGDGFTGNSDPNGAVRVTVTDDGGAPLATGVDGIRFVSTGSLRGSYRELDVVGTVTPEPATAGLLALGGLALLRRRR